VRGEELNPPSSSPGPWGERDWQPPHTPACLEGRGTPLPQGTVRGEALSGDPGDGTGPSALCPLVLTGGGSVAPVSVFWSCGGGLLGGDSRPPSGCAGGSRDRVLPLTLHHVFSLPWSSLSSIDLAWKAHKCLSLLPRLPVVGVYSVSASGGAALLPSSPHTEKKHRCS